MTVHLASIFRDSIEYVDRYFLQVAKLEAHLGEPVRLILCEGDSNDGTFDALSSLLVDHASDDILLKVDHGGPKFGSIDHPQRWAQIALCCNAVMDAFPGGGPLIYVESDLMWAPEMAEQLLEDLAICPAVAPLSMKGDRFYDIWGYRGLDGVQFAGYPPYHPDLDHALAVKVPFPVLVEISSAGSCIAMREEIAHVARFGENDCIVGLGRDIRLRAGGSLWLDTRVETQHP